MNSRPPMSALLRHVAQVIGLRAMEKVMGITARAVVALVQHTSAMRAFGVWNRPDEQFVGHPMGGARKVAAYAHQSIARAWDNKALPRPALIRSTNLNILKPLVENGLIRRVVAAGNTFAAARAVPTYREFVWFSLIGLAAHSANLRNSLTWLRRATGQRAIAPMLHLRGDAGEQTAASFARLGNKKPTVLRLATVAAELLGIPFGPKFLLTGRACFGGEHGI